MLFLKKLTVSICLTFAVLGCDTLIQRQFVVDVQIATSAADIEQRQALAATSDRVCSALREVTEKHGLKENGRCIFQNKWTRVYLEPKNEGRSLVIIEDFVGPGKDYSAWEIEQELKERFADYGIE